MFFMHFRLLQSAHGLSPDMAFGEGYPQQPPFVTRRGKLISPYCQDPTSYYEFSSIQINFTQQSN